MATTLFCVICGEAIKERRSMGRGKNYPLCRNMDCLSVYLNLRESASISIADKQIDPESFLKQKQKERYDGFCGRCGKPLRIDFRNNYMRHGTATLCEKVSTTRSPQQTTKWASIRSRIFKHAEPKPKPRIYLKPWQDPESLFCDTKFLETKILNKKIRTGEECKDKS